jgi:ATP-binding cassette subfamily B protein
MASMSVAWFIVIGSHVAPSHRPEPRNRIMMLDGTLPEARTQARGALRAALHVGPRAGPFTLRCASVLAAQGIQTEGNSMTGAESGTNSQGFGWHRVWGLFGAHRGQVATLLALVLVASVLGVINPLLTQVVFDDALFPAGGSGPDIGLLVALATVMLGITFVGTGLGVWQTYAANRLGQKVLQELRNRVYQHLQSLSLSFYASTRTGELQSRITNDVGGAQTAVSTTLTSILSNAVTFVAALVAMVLLSWQLTLLTLITVPLFMWATRTVGRKRREFTGQAQEATATMNVITQETLTASGFTLARLFGQQDREISRFEEANAELADVTTRQQVIGQAFFTVVGAFLGATPVIVYLVVGFLIDGGTGISAGTVVAFTTLQTRVFFPVARLLETWVELQSSQAMFERIFAYLDMQPDVVEAPNPTSLSRHDSEGRLAFERVHFTYPGGDDDATAALQGVSFQAHAGELIAFVGPSGAGKSTIINLVPRLYDPSEGAVSVDGIDLRDLSFQSLAELIGVVTQEAYLFADTLRANIAYGSPDASDVEIEKAARAAAIHERILEFDDGYDTVVGERGFRLSGGERQRITIARVLLHDPRILVLDEATSALDSASERQIQAALGELISGRTTLAVAHRLSTIQAADTIHVVDSGRIVESGTHQVLLARDGPYRRLYESQYGGGRIETRCADGVVYTDGRYQPYAETDESTRIAALRR